MKILDIGSSNSELEKKLSNFSEFHFVFDGVQCHSMEGLLQSLKFSDPKKQSEICLLVGKKAKFKGKKKKWYLTQSLYWKGKTINRHSKEYQVLLNSIFTSLYSQNKEYRNLLMNTLNFKLTHSIGRSDKNKTILTVEEFCERLDKLRKNIKLS